MNEVNEDSVKEVETKETGFWSKVGACLSTVLKNPEAMKSLALIIPPPYDVMVVLGLQIVGAFMGVDEKDGAKLGYQMNKADKAFDDPEFGGSFEKYKEYLDKDFPFDKTAFDALSPDEKAACNFAGMAGLVQEMKESKGFEVTPDAMGMLFASGASLKWDNPTLVKFSNGMKSALSIVGSFKPVVDAVNGKLDPSNAGTALAAVNAGMKAIPADKAVDAPSYFSAVRGELNKA